MAKQSCGKTLPDDVLNYLLDFLECGFTREIAKKIQLEIIRERKYVIDRENEEVEREFSLCEH